MKSFEDEFKEVVEGLVKQDRVFYQGKEQCPMCKEFKNNNEIHIAEFIGGTTQLCDKCRDSVENIATESAKCWLKAATYRKPFQFLVAMREYMNEPERFVEPLLDLIDDIIREDLFRKGKG